MKGLLTLAVLAMSLASQPAMAAKFSNQFVEFELPPQWQCVLEGAEWVCQSSTDSKKRDAIIVLAAKLRGEQDSLDQYLDYLKTPKSYASLQGKPIKSDPKYAKTIELNGHAWIDALHLDSELPDFYTRYLATIKQDIGVLVTYSINKNKYQEYLQDFETMVKTLRAFRKSGGINAGPANSNLFQNVNIPQGMSEATVFPTVTPQGGSDGGGSSSEAGDDSWIYILAAVGAIAYLIWRRRQR